MSCWSLRVKQLGVWGTDLSTMAREVHTGCLWFFIIVVYPLPFLQWLGGPHRLFTEFWSLLFFQCHSLMTIWVTRNRSSNPPTQMDLTKLLKKKTDPTHLGVHSFVIINIWINECNYYSFWFTYRCIQGSVAKSALLYRMVYGFFLVLQFEYLLKLFIWLVCIQFFLEYSVRFL